MRSLSQKVRLAVLALLAAAGVAAPAAGQSYFGQNKVQYKQFSYQVLRTDNFDIYYYPDESEAALKAARMAERWNARLNRFFAHKLSSRQPLILYANAPDFWQTNVVQGDLGEGTGGVTEGLRRRIVMPLAASLEDTDHVLGHELVHAFQYDMTAVTGPQGLPGIVRLPLWFVEGMAEYISVGPVDPHTAMWMRDAVKQDKLPPIKKLNDPDYFPYRWGQSFWSFVAGKWGDKILPDMLRAAAATGDIDLTIEKLLGVKTEDLSNQWHAALKAQYSPLIEVTVPPDEYGEMVISAEGFGRDLNVAPSISPDGRQLLFLSSRDLFSVDLYLADVVSGKLIRKITATATSPHWSSLQFISSAGDWASDGTRFVFAGVKDGHPVLGIVNIDDGGVEREIPLRNLGEVFNPSWSPDGKRIAFSANVGGLTDLFVYDLEKSELTQLTKDPYADLQPAWSPNGRRLAFVTDRFTTNLESLEYGQLRLALMDASTRKIERVAGFETGKHINPQWASDNGSLYFISDRGGVSNIYRVAIDTGTLTQVTNLYTGITGITSESPALSVASKTNTMAFSLYQKGKYEIWATGQNRTLVGTPPVELGEGAGALPPLAGQRKSDWAAYLANPTLGLPSPEAEFDVTEYRPKLKLDYVGQGSVGAGVDRFGTYATGGIGFAWSDMLGNHNLATVIQVTSGINNRFSNILKDSGGYVAYQNLEHRWNWGVAAQQVPYLTGYVNAGTALVDGRIVGLEETVLYRQTNRNVSGMVAYPFNRAQRVEFSAGYSNIAFSGESRLIAYSLDTGQILADETRDLEGGRALHLGQATAALVYDTSMYGATSPIRGQAYRLEATPNVGTIRFTNLLADYRRYFMPVQLYTVAGRVLHYGRYGRDSEDELLYPLYIGYPQLVRGYDIGSFDTSECEDPTGTTCPAFDRLVGSRMLVGNLEFRFPLLRPFGPSNNVYGPVPVEVAFFADAGVAWNKGEKPEFFGGDRQAVSSAGIALRVNAFGYAVVELDFARPFQRPGKGWTFQFSLTPGF
ncbi:MAG: BamA/TamA family outer membrane protein [Vicinamibacterales bacterium]